MTIQVKATEQYFDVVLFIMLYKVVLTTESTEQYFYVVLFIMLYKVVKSVDETLVCDHSNESC